MTGITIEQLTELCAWSTHIKILRADNGKVVIDGANEMKRSKDKRQMAKWEAFREVNVFDIRPSIEASQLRYLPQNVSLCIVGWMNIHDYEKAMEKISQK